MHKNHILRLLRSSRTGYVSGAELASTLGVSRTAVWKQIKAIERDGYGIEAVPSKGYRLTASPDLIRIDELRSGLATGTIGRDITYVPVAVSTNTTAMELAQRNAAEGTAVVAETQTGGKGRLGRSWISPRGNLYLSVILRPEVPTHKAPLLTLMGAAATANAIRAAAKITAGIKWPNDILINGRKVGGLLTEMSAEQDRIRHIVLGIGVNVNMELTALPDEVRMLSTSIAAETGAPLDRTSLLRQILQELDRCYLAFLADERSVLVAWRALNVTLGMRVVVSGLGGTVEGLAHEIDREGRLLVRLDDGSVQAVAAGDVTIMKRKP